MSRRFELEIGGRYVARICTYSSVKNYMEFTVLEFGDELVKINNATGDHWFTKKEFERDSVFEYDGFYIIEKLPPIKDTTTISSGTSTASTKENKDWEIVEFMCEGGKPFPYSAYSGIWQNKNDWVVFWMKQKTYHINSVKRLSDGEVFSVGDDTQWGIIHSFSIYDTDKLVAQCGDEWSDGKRISRYLKDIHKIKPQQESKRIEVTVFRNVCDCRNGMWMGHYSISRRLTEDETFEIKSAIEKILNNEQ